MNKTRHKGLFVSILLIAIALIAFGSTFFIYQKNTDETDDETITIVTSFYPMYIAAMNVCDGVENITLENLSEPETGCLHDYQLTTEDMKLLSTADVFIINGGGIEEFLVEVAETYPDLVILDASEGITLTEENGHVWMSPTLHKIQVENIAAGLEAYDEENASSYEENAAAYIGQIDELIAECTSLREWTDGEDVILFHEAYVYIAEELGMNVTYIMDLDEERQVSASEVADVLDEVTQNDVNLVLAEEEYGSEMGAMVEEETNASVLYLDTLVRGDYDKASYIDKMRENIEKIAAAYR